MSTHSDSGVWENVDDILLSFTEFPPLPTRADPLPEVFAEALVEWNVDMLTPARPVDLQEWVPTVVIEPKVLAALLRLATNPQEAS